MTMLVHSPTVDFVEVEPQPARPLPKKLGGLQIGVLNNQKPNAQPLLANVVEGLQRGYDVGKAQWNLKPPNLPTLEEELAALEKGPVQLILVASADCGSCTSWCVHDAVVLEKRGKPVMVLATESFLKMARAEAAAYGVPDLRIIPIPHPLGDADAERVKRYAEQAVKTIAGYFP
jgi:hypothetical protein